MCVACACDPIEQELKITLCDCYCLGCLCPCNLTCAKNQGGGGGGPPKAEETGEQSR